MPAGQIPELEEAYRSGREVGLSEVLGWWRKANSFGPQMSNRQVWDDYKQNGMGRYPQLKEMPINVDVELDTPAPVADAAPPKAAPAQQAAPSLWEKAAQGAGKVWETASGVLFQPPMKTIGKLMPEGAQKQYAGWFKGPGDYVTEAIEPAISRLEQNKQLYLKQGWPEWLINAEIGTLSAFQRAGGALGNVAASPGGAAAGGVLRFVPRAARLGLDVGMGGQMAYQTAQEAAKVTQEPTARNVGGLAGDVAVLTPMVVGTGRQARETYQPWAEKRANVRATEKAGLSSDEAAAREKRIALATAAGLTSGAGAPPPASPPAAAPPAPTPGPRPRPRPAPAAPAAAPYQSPLGVDSWVDTVEAAETLGREAAGVAPEAPPVAAPRPAGAAADTRTPEQKRLAREMGFGEPGEPEEQAPPAPRPGTSVGQRITSKIGKDTVSYTFLGENQGRVRYRFNNPAKGIEHEGTMMPEAWGILRDQALKVEEGAAAIRKTVAAAKPALKPAPAAKPAPAPAPAPVEAPAAAGPGPQKIPRGVQIEWRDSEGTMRVGKVSRGITSKVNVLDVVAPDGTVTTIGRHQIVTPNTYFAPRGEGQGEATFGVVRPKARVETPPAPRVPTKAEPRLPPDRQRYLAMNNLQMENAWDQGEGMKIAETFGFKSQLFEPGEEPITRHPPKALWMRLFSEAQAKENNGVRPSGEPIYGGEGTAPKESLDAYSDQDRMGARFSTIPQQIIEETGAKRESRVEEENRRIAAQGAAERERARKAMYDQQDKELSLRQHKAAAHPSNKITSPDQVEVGDRIFVGSRLVRDYRYVVAKRNNQIGVSIIPNGAPLWLPLKSSLLLRVREWAFLHPEGRTAEENAALALQAERIANKPKNVGMVPKGALPKAAPAPEPAPVVETPPPAPTPAPAPEPTVASEMTGLGLAPTPEPPPAKPVRRRKGKEPAPPNTAMQTGMEAGNDYIVTQSNPDMGIERGERLTYSETMSTPKKTYFMDEDNNLRSIDEPLDKIEPYLKRAGGLPLPFKWPQAALTETGRVKLGADVRSLGAVLGSSLYNKPAPEVITKELLQNSLDAIRSLPEGKGEVTLQVDQKKRSITIDDNGPGMTREEVETVFLDLGASGKRSLAAASGGFGLAKAAPLMMSEKLKLVTVADTPQGRFRTSFEATPEQLLGEGVALKHERVSKLYPTGTSVTSILPAKWNEWEIRHAVDVFNRTKKSLALPGTLTLKGEGSWLRPYSYGPLDRPLFKGQIGDAAEVEIVASSKIDEFNKAFGSMGIEVNNNGIYQFDHAIYTGGAADVKGVPTRVAVDIRSLVEEGSPDYPFTANREQLRGPVKEQIEKIIYDKVINPALEEARLFLSEQYDNMPSLQISPNRSVPFYDAGGRLDPKEVGKLSKNVDFLDLASTLVSVAERLRDRATGSPLLMEESGPYTNLGQDIERIGIAFTDKAYGFHIEKPGSDPKVATVMIDPFHFQAGSKPANIASLYLGTIKHEILHDKVPGHYDTFTTGEVRLSEALGELEIEAWEELRNAFADRNDWNALRPGLKEALRIYQESRGRPERVRDIFRGNQSSTGRHVSGPGSAAENAGRLPAGGAGVIQPASTGASLKQRVKDFGKETKGTFKPEELIKGAVDLKDLAKTTFAGMRKKAAEIESASQLNELHNGWSWWWRLGDRPQAGGVGRWIGAWREGMAAPSPEEMKQLSDAELRFHARAIDTELSSLATWGDRGNFDLMTPKGAREYLGWILNPAEKTTEYALKKYLQEFAKTANPSQIQSFLKTLHAPLDALSVLVPGFGNIVKAAEAATKGIPTGDAPPPQTAKPGLSRREALKLPGAIPAVQKAAKAALTRTAEQQLQDRVRQDFPGVPIDVRDVKLVEIWRPKWEVSHVETMPNGKPYKWASTFTSEEVARNTANRLKELGHEATLTRLPVDTQEPPTDFKLFHLGTKAENKAYDAAIHPQVPLEQRKVSDAVSIEATSSDTWSNTFLNERPMLIDGTAEKLLKEKDMRKWAEIKWDEPEPYDVSPHEELSALEGEYQERARVYLSQVDNAKWAEKGSVDLAKIKAELVRRVQDRMGQYQYRGAPPTYRDVLTAAARFRQDAEAIVENTPRGEELPQAWWEDAKRSQATQRLAQLMADTGKDFLGAMDQVLAEAAWKKPDPVEKLRAYQDALAEKLGGKFILQPKKAELSQAVTLPTAKPTPPAAVEASAQPEAALAKETPPPAPTLGQRLVEGAKEFLRDETGAITPRALEPADRRKMGGESPTAGFQQGDRLAIQYKGQPLEYATISGRIRDHSVQVVLPNGGRAEITWLPGQLLQNLKEDLGGGRTRITRGVKVVGGGEERQEVVSIREEAKRAALSEYGAAPPKPEVQTDPAVGSAEGKGFCFRDALSAIIKGQAEGLSNTAGTPLDLADMDNVSLVHGTALVKDAATGEMKRGPHAWVEFTTGKWDFVYDPNLKQVIPAAEYKKAVEPAAEQRFREDEAIRISARAGNSGPWTQSEIAKGQVSGFVSDESGTARMRPLSAIKNFLRDESTQRAIPGTDIGTWGREDFDTFTAAPGETPPPREPRVFETNGRTLEFQKVKTQYGGTEWQIPGTGISVPNQPVLKADLPETLYHVTTRGPQLTRSGMIIAGGGAKRGGMGALYETPVVSLTADRGVAENLQRELLRIVELSSGKAGIGALRRYAMEDAARLGLPVERLRRIAAELEDGIHGAQRREQRELAAGERGEGAKPYYTPERITDELRYAYKQYQMARQRKGFEPDPVILGGAFKNLKPEDVQIVAVPTKNIPDDAFITWNKSKAALDEVRVLADVPLRQQSVAEEIGRFLRSEAGGIPDPYGRRTWFSPQGEEYEVGVGEWHRDWAKRWLKSKGDAYAAERKLKDDGWIRINENNVDMSSKAANLPGASAAIDRAAANASYTGMPFIIVDIDRKPITVPLGRVNEFKFNPLYYFNRYQKISQREEAPPPLRQERSVTAMA